MAEAQTSVQLSGEDSYTLEIRRLIKAPRAKVFDAFVQPEIFGQWWGPKGVTCRNLKIDARVGGDYSLEMHHESGNVHHLSGSYQKIDRPRELVYSWQWGVGDEKGQVTNVALSFNDHTEGTEIVLLHTGFDTAENRDNHNSGWSGSFDCLVQII
jgi:glutathione S-transferase